MMRLVLSAAALVLAQPVLAQTEPTPVVAPDPARIAAAEKAVAALVPTGVYMKMMRDQFPRMMDTMMTEMMGMSPAELGLPDASDGKGKTMGTAITAADPHFQERMQIMTRVMGEEMGSVFGKIEPRMRAGIARVFARKFTTQQLDELNAFFATPTGGMFAGEYLTMLVEPEVMQEMMAVMPEMMKSMPAIVAKVEKATAHLPEPAKAKAKAKK